MITLADAQRVAAEYARRESLRTGQPTLPRVSEFADGFAVWLAPTQQDPPPLGGGYTVIDRASGALSVWPPMPVDEVAAGYAQRLAQAPAPIRTVDPAATLARIGTRHPAPATSVFLTLSDGRVREASGAKGDLTLRHHPLVRQWLAGLPTGHAVRGSDRHAELIVLSDVLHAQDLARVTAGQPLIDLAGARRIFSAGGRHAEVLLVRDQGHPQHGSRIRPCDTCLAAWVHFGLLDPTVLEIFCLPTEPLGGDGPAPEPDAFPADVARVLLAGGWGAAQQLPDGTDFDGLTWAHIAVQDRCAVPGTRHTLEGFLAALDAVARFPLVIAGRRGPGASTWVRPFELVCGDVVDHHADTLGDLAAVLGVALFPIGQEEGGDSLLAVDERGWLFVLDQAGEWFYGADLVTGLTALVQGWQPLRVGDAGQLREA
jgi:hypothetical protein